MKEPGYKVYRTIDKKAELEQLLEVITQSIGIYMEYCNQGKLRAILAEHIVGMAREKK